MHRIEPKPLFAPALKVGDCIGYFSPSSPATHFAPTRYQRARSYLAAKGFRLHSGVLSGAQDAYRSGSIQARAAELNALIRHPDVRCIMSTIGGSNSNSILPYIDYDALRADPKIIIGYSDVTAILLAIHRQTGLVPFYGPALVASFGEFPPLVDETYGYFHDILSAPSIPHRFPSPTHWTDAFIHWETQDRPKPLQSNRVDWLGSGVVQGRLIGGNLNTLWGIWGSPYAPEIRAGDVLLIEDSLKSIAVVERLFAFLHLNGIFDRVSAVLLGKHELFDDGGTGRRPLDVLLEVLNGQDLPIVNGFDCCHTHPMLTVPIGLEVAVDFDEEELRLLEPCVQ